MLYIVLLVVLIILATIFYFVFVNKPKKQEPLLIEGCTRKSFYLSKTEQDFYKQLKEALPQDFMISCQVRVADLFNMPKGLRKSDYSKYSKIFNKYNRKTVDFVVIDDKFKIIFAIELDDKSHKADSRQDRDFEVNQLFAYIKLPLVRYKVGNKYNFTVLKQILDNHQQIASQLKADNVVKKSYY